MSTSLPARHVKRRHPRGAYHISPKIILALLLFFLFGALIGHKIFAPPKAVIPEKVGAIPVYTDFLPENYAGYSGVERRIRYIVIHETDNYSASATARAHDSFLHSEKQKNTPLSWHYTVDENEIYPLDENNEKVQAFKKKYGLDGKFVIMYSGNIGLYYDLENLIKVVERIKPGTKTADGREVVFAFVGAGSVLDKLVLYVKQHHMDNVTFIPYQDKADLIYSLNAGDVHWCVNAKGIKGVSCPSKAYGIMAAAKPILGVLESGSEVRCLIEDTNGGLCCEPGEYDKVEENIRWFIVNAGSGKVKAMGARGRENLEKNLTRNVSVRKYAEEILKL